MSDPKNSVSREDVAAYLLSVPVIVTSRGLSLARQAMGKVMVKRPSQPKPDAVPEAQFSKGPLITANPEFVTANRVHSMFFGPLKVSFFQYTKLQEIRAIARKNGVSRQVIFTPAIAASAGFGYNMDGAIAWVRKTGFANAPAPSPVVAVPKMVIAPATPAIPPAPMTKTKPVPKSTVRPAQGANTFRQRTYVGRIIFLGSAVKPGLNGKPDYETFVLKLETESLAIEKEFIGEHLAELTDQHSLAVGNTIELTALGKTFFTVTVGDKEEERSRNGYAVKVISQ